MAHGKGRFVQRWRSQLSFLVVLLAATTCLPKARAQRRDDGFNKGQESGVRGPVPVPLPNQPNPNCPEVECSGVVEPLCGSDGITYRNECEFSDAQCREPSLTVMFEEECAVGRGLFDDDDSNNSDDDDDSQDLLFLLLLASLIPLLLSMCCRQQQQCCCQQCCCCRPCYCCC